RSHVSAVLCSRQSLSRGRIVIHPRKHLFRRVGSFLQRVPAGDHDGRPGRQGVESRVCVRVSRRRAAIGCQSAAGVAGRTIGTLNRFSCSFVTTIGRRLVGRIFTDHFCTTQETGREEKS